MKTHIGRILVMLFAFASLAFLKAPAWAAMGLAMIYAFQVFPEKP